MFTVTSLPILSDNYCYIVTSQEDLALVDPGEAGTVLDWLQEKELTPSQLWLTHHHYDHVGGALEICQKYPEITLIASELDKERLPSELLKQEVWWQNEGTHWMLGSQKMLSWHAPGHTKGHMIYLTEDYNDLFVGDVLFAGGCGRAFEGEASELHQSFERIAQLPQETRLWFGHEYTQSNLRFARHCEPNNQAIAKRLQALCPPSTPTTVELEKATNPFLRASHPSLQKFTQEDEPSKVFTRLRELKNSF